MDGKHLSKRLLAVANQVPKNSRLADIGSDHAYLPIYLAKNHLISFCIAGEVVKGPFHNAEREIKCNGVQKMIIPRLANGLDAIHSNDNVNVITIAGMGGNLISHILERGVKFHRIDGSELLILQPNIGEYGLRSWLMFHHYQIKNEQIVEDDHEIYEIIVASKSKSQVFYTQNELYFGPILLKQHSLILLKKYREAYLRMKDVIYQMQFAKSNQAQIKLNNIKARMRSIQKMIGDN